MDLIRLFSIIADDPTLCTLSIIAFWLGCLLPWAVQKNREADIDYENSDPEIEDHLIP